MYIKKALILFLSAVSALLFFLLLFSSAFFAFIQTDWGKEKIKEGLISYAAKRGVSLEIEEIKGRLPFHWKMKNISLSTPSHIVIKARSAKGVISLTSLIHGELSLKKISIAKAQITSDDFQTPLLCMQGRAKTTSHLQSFFLDLTAFAQDDPQLFLHATAAKRKKEEFTAALTLKAPSTQFLGEKFPLLSPEPLTAQLFIHGPLEGPYQLERIDLTSPSIHLQANGILARDLSLPAFSINFSFPQFFAATGELHYRDSHLSITATAPAFSLKNQEFSSLSFSLEADHEKSLWLANSSCTLASPSLPLSLQTTFSFSPNQFLNFSEIYLLAPESEIGGSLSWDLQKKWEGSLFAQSTNLGHFRNLLPHLTLQGKAGIECTLSYLHEQILQIHAAATQFHCQNSTAKQIDLAVKVNDPFAAPQITGSLEGEGFDYKDIHLETFFLSSSDLPFELNHAEMQQKEFSIKLCGEWGGALEFDSSGLFSLNKEKNWIKVATAQGALLQKLFSLKNPAELEWGPSHFTLTPCQIAYTGGELLGSCSLSSQERRISLDASHFPLELLIAPFFGPTVNGSATLHLHYDSQPSQQGSLSVILEQAKLFPLGRSEPLQADGSLQLNLQDEKLQIHSHLLTSENQTLFLSAHLPLHTGTGLFPFLLNQDAPCSIELTANGNMETFLTFFDLSNQAIRGQLSSHLFITHTLQDPYLQGSLEIENGVYENYTIGTCVKNIQGSFLAQQKQIAISSLQGEGEQGKVTATGSFEIDPKRNFPYSFALDLKNMSAIAFDNLSAQATGPLTLQGNISKLLVEGSLALQKADIRIPDEAPVTIYELPVTFIHLPNQEEPLPSSLFPVSYELQLQGERSIFVQGRGLKSEWKGKARIGGTDRDFHSEGSLELVKGEFFFSGHSFTLTTGEISFINEQALLNLKGTLSIGDSTITAILSGPLSSPNLTFTSNPQMPTSSILARIIFNKDIAEISPFQAIQLAHMIVTLSGKGAPNVLENIQRSLGIDRFTIVSSDANPDVISLQIGKYLARGVMVTLSQSANSSQVIVEVELKNGFLFQAETQENEEGKFTLKWNHNY